MTKSYYIELKCHNLAKFVIFTKKCLRKTNNFTVKNTKFYVRQLRFWKKSIFQHKVAILK